MKPLKFMSSVNLWNRDQWHHCWRPKNILHFCRQDAGGWYETWIFTILGFVFFFERDL